MSVIKSYDSTAERLPDTESNDTGDNSAKSSSSQVVNHGISALTAAIFIVGEMAGSGVLALPRAVVDAGWIGLIIIIVLCLTACYGGTRLGVCWEIIEERYPEYRGITRNPYPTIANKAVGRWGSVLVSASIQITLFGAGIVYLLLASQIVQDLMKPLVPKLTFCTWFIIFAIIITPPMWLGSPKDFWIVGVGAVVTTTLSCGFIFIQMMLDGIHQTDPVPHKSKSFLEFFLSFGIILFSFGGASTFPTIQNDMLNRTRFKRSVFGAFCVILLLYLPISIGAFFIYGDNTNANIVLSLSRGPYVLLANIFMACHLILAFLIVVNPVCQEVENIFNTPHEFGFKRCLIRTCMVIMMVIIGVSIPSFAKLLSLVGGSTVTLLTFVLPNYFYMKLCDQECDSWTKRDIPCYMRVYMWELIFIGILGGAASTYSAFQSIFDSDSMSKPCYSF
ncbi:amino acid transporter AVT1A-like isoform X1 [Cimex lectularius]|uniref:Amino acid transporter transmembrane domain-containing protein n=2 Tax=Cimex lectularius TaxID=79782 RepID=A0A8I6TDL5_CIMLE|nr:amino acid transporter AVT1A-like isoform X1 [Cimex lectularius]